MIVKRAQFFVERAAFFYSYRSLCVVSFKEEETQQIDLFEEKKICQLASKQYSTSFHII